MLWFTLILRSRDDIGTDFGIFKNIFSSASDGKNVSLLASRYHFVTHIHRVLVSYLSENPNVLLNSFIIVSQSY